MNANPETLTADQAEDLANDVREAWEGHLAANGREDEFPSEQQETSHLLDALEAEDAGGTTWELQFPNGTARTFVVTDQA